MTRRDPKRTSTRTRSQGKRAQGERARRSGAGRTESSWPVRVVERSRSVLGHTWHSWFGGTSQLRGPATVYAEAGVDRWRWLVVDCVAVLALLALATLAFWPLYATGWLWVASMGGAVLGVGIGAVGVVRRWQTWVIAVALAVAYLVFGSALAMPQLATYHVVPTARTLSGLVFGSVQAWKASLTMDAPLGLTDNLLVVPLITMLLAGVIGISVATRSGRPSWGWVAPAVAMATGIAFGLQTAWWPVVIGLGFFAVALVWNAYRRDYQRQTLLSRRRRYSARVVLGATGVLLVTALLTTLVSPLVSPAGPRHVLRDVVTPPLDVRAWPSPLQSYRANLTEHRTDVLFTVEGLPAGTPIRIATLDAYDGNTMNVATSLSGGSGGGEFRRIGSRVPDTTPGVPVSYSIEIEDYRGRWLPTVGKTLTWTFTGPERIEQSENLFYNRATGTGVARTGLTGEEAYTVEAVIPAQPERGVVAEADVEQVDLPPATPVAQELVTKAQEWTNGARTDGEAAIRLETELRKGYYSRGLANDVPSLPGHGSYRMTQLMTDHEGQLVGDEEQYAVAMALMARELGMPARVVYGYQPPSSGRVTGDDVSAWVEIAFEGLGWVIFNPTPDKSRALPPDDTRSQSRPRPQVENPPPPPTRPERLPPDRTPPQDSQEEQEPEPPIDLAAVLSIMALVGIPLLVLLAPMAVVLIWKARRRALRRTRGSPTERIEGGWDEVIDRIRDLGGQPSGRATRSENVATLVGAGAGSGAGTATGPGASSAGGPESRSVPVDGAGSGGLPGSGSLRLEPAELAELARRADRATFGATPPGEPEVDVYWRHVIAASGALGASVSWWRRVRGALSFRSLRRLT
ncbi:transglutaminaseTgpA domain-containing protein [Propionibacteriaceae bacterium Y2011]